MKVNTILLFMLLLAVIAYVLRDGIISEHEEAAIELLTTACGIDQALTSAVVDAVNSSMM